MSAFANNNPLANELGIGSVAGERQPDAHHRGRDTVRGYVNDLIAAHRHVLEAMKRHPKDSSLMQVAGAAETLSDVCTRLQWNIEVLEQCTSELGGKGAAGHLKEALTVMSGAVTGIYGQLRPEAASRMLRDDHTALNFLMTCSWMLHITARSLGEDATADRSEQIVRGFPPLIGRVSHMLAAAVVTDLRKEGHELMTESTSTGIALWQDAWTRG
ncbi:MAG TPA: hypothetical protein VK176_05025 [Phycisphaerales bacterium]|nr:hypothetical protein [Phycisphaerales bacterium]